MTKIALKRRFFGLDEIAKTIKISYISQYLGCLAVNMCYLSPIGSFWLKENVYKLTFYNNFDDKTRKSNISPKWAKMGKIGQFRDKFENAII